ncbi:MAG: DUF222 domain-containing protein [Acidimicrobiales bacterium]
MADPTTTNAEDRGEMPPLAAFGHRGLRAPAPGELAARVAAIEIELKELRAVDVGLADPDEIAAHAVVMARVGTCVEAEVAKAAVALDESGVWATGRCGTARSWLTDRTGVSRAAAGRWLRHGKAMRTLGLAGAAWETGEITTDHLSRLVRARNPRTAELMDRDEAQLVEQAKVLGFVEFDRLIGYWSHLADADGAEQDAETDRAARSAYVTRTFSGMWLGQITLDPVNGAIVALELERLEAELFDADRAEAKKRLGRDPKPEDLARTPTQRRADALVEMAKRSAAMPADATQARPLFTVLVGEGTFRHLCEIETTNQPIAPGAVREWLDQALFERIVFDGPNRVIEVSQRRIFPDALRRAIQVRDRACVDGCRTPATRGQVDHVIPADAGGPTAEHNGEIRCAPANAAKGTTWGTRVNPDPDRYLRWLNNRGADPEQGRPDREQGGPDRDERSPDREEGGPDPP